MPCEAVGTLGTEEELMASQFGTWDRGLTSGRSGGETETEDGLQSASWASFAIRRWFHPSLV